MRQKTSIVYMNKNRKTYFEVGSIAIYVFKVYILKIPKKYFEFAIATHIER